MALEANVPYELALEFVPALTTLDQYRAVCRKTCGDRIQLVKLSPKTASVLVVYEAAPTRIQVGVVLFKVGGASSRGGTSPVSSAVIRAITKPSVRGA